MAEVRFFFEQAALGFIDMMVYGGHSVMMLVYRQISITVRHIIKAGIVRIRLDVHRPESFCDQIAGNDCIAAATF